jgi:WD40 repeat protein
MNQLLLLFVFLYSAAVTAADITDFRGDSPTFSPDGTRALTIVPDNGVDTGAVTIWDVVSGTVAARVNSPQHYLPVYFAEFSPDGRRVFSKAGGDVQLLDLASGTLTILRPKLERDEASFFGILRAMFSPDGTRVITIGVGLKARIWDTASGEEIAVFKRPHGYPRPDSDQLAINGFSLDNTLAATTSGYVPKVEIWDAASGQVITQLERASFLAFSPDGRRILIRDENPNDITAPHDTHICDAYTGERLAMSKAVNAVRFSPDGTRLVADGPFGVGVFDAASGTELQALTQDSRFRSAHFFQDGTKIFASSTRAEAQIWDSASGTTTATFKGTYDHQWDAHWQISPDGRLVLMVGKAVQLWYARSGELLASLDGPRDVLLSVAEFSPDSKRVIAGPDRDSSFGHISRMWNLEAMPFWKDLRP